MKKRVIGEVHYALPGQTVAFNHCNIVKGSFVSNFPVIVNYKNGTFRVPNYCNTSLYAPTAEGMYEIKVSYIYGTE